MLGSFEYMSPEIHCEEEYSMKTDVWSLGVILFELCMLDIPFKSLTPAILAKKVKKEPTPNIPERYTDDLRALLNHML